MTTSGELNKRNCELCGADITGTRTNRRYCVGCSAIKQKEYKAAWNSRNPEQLRAIKDEVNRRKREKNAQKEKTYTCVVCGETKKKRTIQKQCPGECRKIVRSRREKLRHIPKTQRNGTDFICLLCGDTSLRSAHNQKYCPECEKRIASHRQRRRALQKRRVGGTHTKLDFLNLCKAYLWKCAYCGKALTLKTVTEDHVIPLISGGSDDISNIAPACVSCNCSKSSQPVDIFLEKRRCVSVS